MTLDSMFSKARAYDSAQRHSENYVSLSYQTNSITGDVPTHHDNKETVIPLSAAQSANELCYFCGNRCYPRTKCPAREVDCNKCGKFAKVCKSAKPIYNQSGASTSLIFKPTLASMISGNVGGLNKSICKILINGNNVDYLIDSGSTDSFIHPNLVDKFSLPMTKTNAKVQMASTSLFSPIISMCNIDIELNKVKYNVTLKVMKDLCADVILGLEFQLQHESITIMLGGSKEPLVISALTTLKN